jgi:hypothetical protein
VRAVFGEVPVQRCIRHYADVLVMPTWRVIGPGLVRMVA